MTSLEELKAYWLCKAVDIGLIGSVVASNKSLRSLEVQCRHCCDLWAHQSDSPPHEVSVMEPWVLGLKTNRTLERLTIDLSLYTAYECCLLIDAIAVNVSIVTVTVRNIADSGCIQAVYARIRDRKMQHRVVVEDHHVGLNDVKELPLFPEASVVTLSSWHFEQPTALCTAIQGLAACIHITALRLRFTYYDRDLYTPAAKYIAATVTLRDIELFCGACCPDWFTISLLVARLPDFGLPLEAEMATLHDVTRRNCRLVDLASRFMIGDDRDSSTKSALSLVSQHPKLLEAVAQKKGVSQTEVMSMIEESRPLPPFSDVRSCS
ncbi:hypothetical protein HPB52_021095 [Rhipicephalus sanguineus]|uniref:Uncharacterized protein n=1 Tax=Rhipicephalus sanguineus TaxID=34632 RepID=A0A9D4QC23_RHISA|nr:hypothetical protein HPB52_021095 [Rhipicephalus sanguineus]